MRIAFRCFIGLCSACLVVAGCVSGGSKAPAEGSVASHSAADRGARPIASSEERAAALAALERMSDFLAAQAQLSFEAEVGWDAAQAGGESLEFGGWREVLLARPDRVFSESRDRNGGVDQVIFDGTTLTVALLDAGLYAQVEQPGSVDAALDHLGSERGVPTPLSDLVQADLYGAVSGRIAQARPVGRALVAGVVCEHYWFRSADVDFELWIAEGEFPLPRRMVIRYFDGEARPTYRALFSEWDLSPDLVASDFAFAPGEASKAVDFDALLEVLK